MYSLSDYLWMVADETRVAAYAGALRALIAPGARVLEVGAGFGFFSIVAAQCGAAHVDAVETNPAVHLGAKVAAANGCADRITFHHRDVSQLQLEAPADVLVIDVRGPTPFGSRSLEVLIDARDRLLCPGGTIVAARDRIFAAPCRTPAVFRREVQRAHGRQGIDLDAVERVVYDTPMRCTIDRGDLLADGQPWIVLDYRTVERRDGAGVVEWQLARGGAVDGLAIWFETDLGGGWGFSTEPGSAVQAYRQMFIPFRAPVAAAAGDRFRVQLAARPVRENYLWEWRAWLHPAASGTERLVVDQNSLAEIVLDPASFPDTGPDARPRLGVRGKAVLALLTRMDGKHSVSDLVSHLAAELPALFPDSGSAHDFVTAWLQRSDRLERGGD